MPRENSSCVIHFASVISGTSIQAAVANAPMPTSAARPARRQKSVGDNNTHTPKLRRAR